MTQKDKELLLKDLCCRLPYGVYIQTKRYNIPIELRYISIDNIPEIKPYLRPMLSMTEEEKEWLYSNFDYIESFGIKCYDKIPEYYDWLNEHHFDYRGLIEKGLAIDCTNLDIY